MKQFLIDCFTKLGEKLDIQFSSCACSSDEDVVPPRPRRRRRQAREVSTSEPLARLEDMSFHQPGNEHVEGEDSDLDSDSDDNHDGVYVPEDFDD